MITVTIIDISDSVTYTNAIEIVDDEYYAYYQYQYRRLQYE